MADALRRGDLGAFAERAADAPGFTPLTYTALDYARRGLTSLAEVQRIASEGSDPTAGAGSRDPQQARAEAAVRAGEAATASTPGAMPGAGAGTGGDPAPAAEGPVTDTPELGEQAPPDEPNAWRLEDT